MKRLRNRMIAWVMSLALIAAMLPISPAVSTAATSSYFQFSDFSTAITAPSDVNGNVIDIAGTFTGISSSSISYKIEKLVPLTTVPTTDADYKVAESSVSSTRPVITGSNSFRFAAVTIYEGLNRISIIGLNTAGNTVNATAYVNFTNVPVISEIKLIDGTILPEGTSIVATTPTATISLKAPNATEVTINGTQMFGGSGSSFVLSGLQLTHGLNKLVVIAKNGTKSYQLTRYLVYYNGTLTAYNVMLGTNSLDGNPTISADVTNNAVSGNVVIPYSGTVPITPSIQVQLWKTSELSVSGATYLASSTTTGTLLETSSDYATYKFTTGTSFNLTSNGDYSLKIIGPSSALIDIVPFKYLSSGSPYITGVKQAYSVTGTSTISYASSANFADHASIATLPVWLVLETANLASSPAPTTTIKVEQNGVDVTLSSVISTAITTDGMPAVLLSNLPAGELKLTFTIAQSGKTYSVVRNVTYYPAPSIQIDNLYSGQVFNDPTVFSTMNIVGKLLNFNLGNASELSSLKVSLNGATVPLSQGSGTTAGSNISLSSGKFTFLPGTSIALVAGANTITFTGTAGGIPVTTSITVYLFSSDEPSVNSIHPVPYVLPPENDDITLPLRKFSDSEVKFAVSGDNEYTTTEKSLDLLFKALDFDTMEIQVDGNVVATGAISTTTAGQLGVVDTVTTDTIKIYIDKNATTQPTPVYTLGTGEKDYQLRLSNVKLPTSGKTSITIVLHKGTSTVSQTVTIIRDLSPYIVLSPKLPNEAVINANFLKISIKAEGANQVLVGKVAMTKGDGDIFRYELQGLKAGKNTVKFTVVTGTQKVNGSFDVTYAADDSITAQYKTSIASSGKISIFKGDLQLAFPKNTFLRQANTSPGQDVKTVDLFNTQQIYFGIADRTDGRTVKKYNAVGETDTNGNYLDGTIKDIATDTYAVDRLRTKTNFSYASSLFWIDAGYFDNSTSVLGDYSLVNAMQPYQTSNMFYGRVYDTAKWLEPSQRGTITIKYDSDISDAYGQNLSVWRYTSNGWENIGGIVNTGNKTVTAPFDGFGYYTVMGLRYSFSDIIGHAYARLSLESMFAHGIMNNKDANSFGVYENITRGEFSQMLVKIMGIPLEYNPNNMTFDDVQPYDYPDQPYWNYKYVETAVKKGYIRGKSPRLFFPNDYLTRAEASVMIARALNLVKSNADATKDLAALQKSFTDASQTDVYAVSSVLAINKAGFIAGIANTVTNGKATYRFEPNSNLSRADAAVIAQRVMKKLKKL